MIEKKEQKNENAMVVENVSKKFVIPHDKASTLKGAFINLFHKNQSEVFSALKDVSFEIKKGEFFGIIGRNGSGKSTLLKILAGIYSSDTGKVKINGKISPFLELGIGFNPELSGRDNIYLNATVLGLTKKQIDEKFDSIVAFSELERFIDQKLKNYSSGMSVRLAFSVAIHANRDILLMDEVLAVGDSNFQSKCLQEFNKYRDQGKTVVLVTHDIGTVQRYCDRAMLLRHGKIEKIGNPEEVGNEYIYQNMSDEEKRILKEQEREKERIEKERIQAERQKEREAEEMEKLKGKEREEEMRRIEEEIIRQEEERKNKVAEITAVEFLDKDGKVKNVFETGEDISIRVYFKQNKKIDLLNFGIGVFNQEGHYVFGVNTIMDKVDTGDCLNKNYFQITYREIPLNKGVYFINCAIYGKGEEIAYDYLPKSKIFQVFCKSDYRGVVKLIYQWD